MSVGSKSNRQPICPPSRRLAYIWLTNRIATRSEGEPCADASFPTAIVCGSSWPSWVHCSRAQALGPRLPKPRQPWSLSLVHSEDSLEGFARVVAEHATQPTVDILVVLAAPKPAAWCSAAPAPGDAVESRSVIFGFTDSGSQDNELQEGSVRVWWGDDPDLQRGLIFGSTNTILDQHLYQMAGSGGCSTSSSSPTTTSSLVSGWSVGLRSSRG